MVLNFTTEIEILLNDQNKIVTYKEISNKFDLTPFEAKKKLEQFVSTKRDKENEKTNFHVTYLINGEDKSTNGKRIFLVNENELDSKIKDFKVLSKQIYSVQKNLIEDFSLIFTSDIDSSNNIDRKSNLNLIGNVNDCKNVKKDQPDIKPNIETLNQVAQSTKALPQSTSISNLNSNSAKSNILVDSVKTNIKKEDQQTEKNTKKDDSAKISETVNKKLKITEEQPVKEAETKPLIKMATKKAEPPKKTTNQSITSFFKKS